MLEILLGIKIKNIDYIRSENIIENYYQSRGIRMDVFVQNSDRVFDIEMQTGNYSDLLLRSRYYQGAMDVATMERSTSYSDLKESYIIFICKDDPFGFGCASYTKSVTFKECPDFLYNDKSNVVF